MCANGKMRTAPFLVIVYPYAAREFRLAKEVRQRLTVDEVQEDKPDRELTQKLAYSIT